MDVKYMGKYIKFIFAKKLYNRIVYIFFYEYEMYLLKYISHIYLIVWGLYSERIILKRTF